MIQVSKLSRNWLGVQGGWRTFSAEEQRWSSLELLEDKEQGEMVGDEAGVSSVSPRRTWHAGTIPQSWAVEATVLDRSLAHRVRKTKPNQFPLRMSLMKQ